MTTDTTPTADHVIDTTADKAKLGADKVKDNVAAIKDATVRATQTAGEKLQHAAETVGEKLKEAAEVVSEKLKDAGVAVKDASSHIKHKLER